MSRNRGTAKLFAPTWAGGWALTRVLFGLAALDAHVARLPNVEDALEAGVSLASGPARLVDVPVFSAGAAWAVWAFGVVAAAGVVWGGRGTRLSVALFALAHAGLLVGMGLNVRAPERLMMFATVAMLLGPVEERGLTEKWRTPAVRWYVLVLFASLYGSTGLMKLVDEPGWLTGEVLAYDLVDRWHAGGAVATWLSGQRSLVTAMGWATVAIELALPFLLWFRSTALLAVLAGIGLHGSIGFLMDVGPLGTLALALYPVAIHPEATEAWWRKWRAWRTGEASS